MRFIAAPVMYSVMGSSIAFAAAAAALSFQSVAGGLSTPLEPTGPWTAEATDAMCLVGRKFGPAGQEMTLGIRKIPASGKLRVALWVPDASTKASKGIAELRLDEGSPISAPFIKGQVDVAGLHLVAIDASEEQLPDLATAMALHVAAGEVVQSFHLRGIGGAMKALSECEEKVLASWGVDPAVIASIETAAALKSNPMSLFSVNDYPSSAMSRKEQGISAVRLVVGIDGRPRNCGVVESSGSRALDEKTCDIHLTRARYEPARTATGEAVPSIVFQRMRWEMPN